MATYIDLDGLRTWYDELGDGDPLVLPHPGTRGVAGRAAPTDLVQKLISVATIFHRDGWIPEAVDPDVAPPQFLASMYGEVSPDGVEHFPAVFAKAARMHSEEPTLTADDLRGVCNKIMVGFLTTDAVPTIAPIRRAAG